MNVLVTGGAGYIGSHACKRLLSEGHNVTVLDNLYRGHAEAIDAVRAHAGADESRLHLRRGDIRDFDGVCALLRERNIETVMHFAALAYVGESVDTPLEYYDNNTAGALSLIRACESQGVQRFIFSSTCATYGEPSPEHIPIAETCLQDPINPYGYSKLAIERVLADYANGVRRAGRPFAFAALRYFNVAGCDPEGVIGEDHEPETHLIPVVIQAALGLRESITVFGTDYPTPDGTCIRDYIHVVDLVDAHVQVMNALDPTDPKRNELRFNLGIGNGLSVREIIESVKRVSGREFKVVEGERRAGDPPMLYADASRIRSELGWQASMREIDEIVSTAWAWFEKHPSGYAGQEHAQCRGG